MKLGLHRTVSVRLHVVIFDAILGLIRTVLLALHLGRELFQEWETFDQKIGRECPRLGLTYQYQNSRICVPISRSCQDYVDAQLAVVAVVSFCGFTVCLADEQHAGPFFERTYHIYGMGELAVCLLLERLWLLFLVFNGLCVQDLLSALLRNIYCHHSAYSNANVCFPLSAGPWMHAAYFIVFSTKSYPLGANCQVHSSLFKLRSLMTWSATAAAMVLQPCSYFFSSGCGRIP